MTTVNTPFTVDWKEEENCKSGRAGIVQEKHTEKEVWNFRRMGWSTGATFNLEVWCRKSLRTTNQESKNGPWPLQLIKYKSFKT